MEIRRESRRSLTERFVLIEGQSRLVRRGGWKGFSLDFMIGSDVRDRQLGVIGMGRIGQAVAARAAPEEQKPREEEARDLSR